MENLPVDVVKSMGVDIVARWTPASGRSPQGADLGARGLEPGRHDHDDARDRPAAVTAHRQRLSSAGSRGTPVHRFHGHRAADRPRPAATAQRGTVGAAIAGRGHVAALCGRAHRYGKERRSCISCARTSARALQRAHPGRARSRPRPAARPGGDGRATLAFLRQRQLRGARLPPRPGRRADRHRGQREAEELGPEFPALRARAAERLPGRQQFQRWRTGAGDRGEPVRRRVADRPAGRRESAVPDRVLPADRVHLGLVRRAAPPGRAAEPRHLRGERCPPLSHRRSRARIRLRARVRQLG